MRLIHWLHKEWVHATIELLHVCHVVWHGKIMAVAGLH